MQDPVSVVAEQLLVDVSCFGGSEITYSQFIERRERQSENLSLACRQLLRDTKLHIDSTGFHLLQFSVTTPPQNICEEAASAAPRPPSPLPSPPAISRNAVAATAEGGSHHRSACNMESTSRNAEAPTTHSDLSKEPIDKAAKKLLDEISEHESPKNTCAQWCQERKFILLSSAVVLATGMATYFLMRKRQK